MDDNNLSKGEREREEGDVGFYLFDVCVVFVDVDDVTVIVSIFMGESNRV
jgi:hypothetical protein